MVIDCNEKNAKEVDNNSGDFYLIGYTRMKNKSSLQLFFTAYKLQKRRPKLPYKNGI
jgi:hypothetical protein